MMKEYQVTLFAKNGKYRPVACIVRTDKVYDLESSTDRKALIKEGTQKICTFRRWTVRDLETYTYLVAKVRKNDDKKKNDKK